MTEGSATFGEHGAHSYHYTTADAAFAHILPTASLRMSSFAEMRDPVENKDWAEHITASEPEREAKISKLRHLVGQTVHQTKLLSFTLDAESSEDPHCRGCARPRMWEQYAENHAGVCLVFDHERLKKHLLSALAAFNDVYAGSIDYRNEPIPNAAGARTLDADEIEELGEGDVRQGLRKHLHLHVGEIFFRKLEDWATEQEYRFVVLDEDTHTNLVPLDDTLRAVIVGEHFPEWQVPSATAVCAAAGVELRKMKFGPLSPVITVPTS